MWQDLTREMSLLHQELEKSNMNMELLDLRSLLHEHILDLITSVKSQMMEYDSLVYICFICTLIFENKHAA